jgi:hypothetical protein
LITNALHVAANSLIRALIIDFGCTVSISSVEQQRLRCSFLRFTVPCSSASPGSMYRDGNILVAKLHCCESDFPTSCSKVANRSSIDIVKHFCCGVTVQVNHGEAGAEFYRVLQVCPF